MKTDLDRLKALEKQRSDLWKQEQKLQKQGDDVHAAICALKSKIVNDRWDAIKVGDVLRKGRSIVEITGKFNNTDTRFNGNQHYITLSKEISICRNGPRIPKMWLGVDGFATSEGWKVEQR